MKEEPQHLYWDTCVFIAYLNDEREAYGELVSHIGQYLREASAGKCKIYCSTITIAEITCRFLANAEQSTFNEFLEDFSGAVIPISPDPNIMNIASHLRGHNYVKTNGNRPLLTPDAIHLATAVALQDTFGVPLDAFHTFDKGNKNGASGKSVPLIGLGEWCSECEGDEVVKKVLNMAPSKPIHPSPEIV